MAKTKMICPFSGKPCKECPIYRGRHYFMCFNSSYRGHLNEADNASREINTSVNVPEKVEGLFKLQAVSNTRSIDPFTANMPDII